MYNVHKYQSCMLQVDYRSTAVVNLGCPPGGGCCCGREREKMIKLWNGRNMDFYSTTKLLTKRVLRGYIWNLGGAKLNICIGK